MGNISQHSQYDAFRRIWERMDGELIGGPDGQSVGMAVPVDPVGARLAAIELRQAEIERKLDNLTEYMRTLMTNGQKLRCTRPDR